LIGPLAPFPCLAVGSLHSSPGFGADPFPPTGLFRMPWSAPCFLGFPRKVSPSSLTFQLPLRLASFPRGRIPCSLFSDLRSPNPLAVLLLIHLQFFAHFCCFLQPVGSPSAFLLSFATARLRMPASSSPLFRTPFSLLTLGSAGPIRPLSLPLPLGICSPFLRQSLAS